jgi:hypothetical protein
MNRPIKQSKNHNISPIILIIVVILFVIGFYTCNSKNEIVETYPQKATTLVNIPSTTTIKSQTKTVISNGTASPTTLITDTPLPLYPPEFWQTRWIRGEPCSPPCWENITPGITSVKDATEYLRANPWIRNVFVRMEKDQGYIVWEWNNGEEGGDILFDTGSLESPIRFIRPYLSSRNRFGDIVAKFGEPSDVKAFAETTPDRPVRILYTIEVIFRSKGLHLRSSQNPFIKPDLSPETIFDIVSFFSSEDSLDNVFKYSKNFISPWQGYKGFDYYCKDNSLGSICSQ